MQISEELFDEYTIFFGFIVIRLFETGQETLTFLNNTSIEVLHLHLNFG